MNSYADKPIVTAGIVVIGNEILSGRTQDTNSNWIAKKLTNHGINLSEIRVVPDVDTMIVEAVNTLRVRYDYVFTTGGIGPTHDDITASCIAKAFDVPFEKNQEAYDILLEYYGAEDLTPARATMADMPRGVELLPNPVSGAPGFALENVYVMAGVPRIMQSMMDFILHDKISGGAVLLSNTVMVPVPESALAEDLAHLQNKYPEVQIGSYPNYRDSSFGVSVVFRGINEEDIKSATRDFIDYLDVSELQPTTISYQVPID